MWLYIVQGIGYGFAAAVQPGPFQTYLISQALLKGWKRGAPYDLILIDGAVEHVPEAIAGQLAEDGRLATGLIEHGVQRLALGRRAGESFGLAAFADVACAVLPGFEKPRVFSF